MAIDPNTSFLVIKITENCSDFKIFRSRLTQTETDKTCYAYYNVTGRNYTSAEDKAVFNALDPNAQYACAVVDFNEKFHITKLYWTTAEICASGKALRCQCAYRTEDQGVINYFCRSLIDFDLKKDFGGAWSKRYMYWDSNTKLMDFMNNPKKPGYNEKKYLAAKTTAPWVRYDYCMDPLAQRDAYCVRKYDASHMVGMRSVDGEYSKDYDAIVSSKAFRRMVDKAQVFSAAKGDHYRTRMTHSQVVCYIARRICDELKLNSRLAEAIAMGHDLGHTPFGHQGERTLNEILKGEVYQILPSTVNNGQAFSTFAKEYGGFKHNYQSVRVATTLESVYPGFDGLNLSAQTLNGMWMHTKTDAAKFKIEKFADGFAEIYRDANAKNADDDHYGVPFTLEGQVVAVADEIAQRSHDIDDAFASGMLSVEEFIDGLISYMEPRKAMKSTLPTEAKDLKAAIAEACDKDNKLFADEAEMYSAAFSAVIVDHFIKEVCDATKENMRQYKEDIVTAHNSKSSTVLSPRNPRDVLTVFSADPYIRKKVVTLSRVGDAWSQYLEAQINNNVLKSDGVQLFDTNGGNVVLALFKAYYNNPLLLHAGTRKRIWNQYLEEGWEWIPLEDLAIGAAKAKWTAMTVGIDDPKNKGEYDTLVKKHIILVRAICDYISGMTDSYAMNEYHKIIHQP